MEAKSVKAKFTKGLGDNILAAYVACSMGLYGLGKFVQFKGAAELDKNLGELTGMELMWAFYGYSLTLPLIVGFLEVTGGILIYFRKTRLLGCFILTTLLINIIIQDFIYGILFGAILSAMVYQLIIFYFMYKHRSQMKKALMALTTFQTPKLSFVRWVGHTLIGLAIAVMIKMTIGI